MAARRAVREFAVSGDPWQALDAWAERNGYQALERSAEHVLYRKGKGFWVGSRKVDVRKSGDQIHIEAWVAANLFVRVTSFFILPAEMTIESGGFKGTIPRKMGRSEVNDLLQSFGQPLIA